MCFCFCTPLLTVACLIACTLVGLSQWCYQWEREYGECEANNNSSNDDNNNKVITFFWGCFLKQACLL